MIWLALFPTFLAGVVLGGFIVGLYWADVLDD